MPELLDDEWESLAFPVLLAIARTAKNHDELDLHPLADELGVRFRDVQAAVHALKDTGYVINCLMSHGDAGGFMVSHVRLSEKARRAVGLWPRQDAAADALIDLLAQAADQTEDEDDAGALRRAGRLLRGVPSAVLADVTAALIRHQTGLS
jgi:hypothetical protein